MEEREMNIKYCNTSTTCSVHSLYVVICNVHCYKCNFTFFHSLFYRYFPYPFPSPFSLFFNSFNSSLLFTPSHLSSVLLSLPFVSPTQSYFSPLGNYFHYNPCCNIFAIQWPWIFIDFQISSVLNTCAIYDWYLCTCL